MITDQFFLSGKYSSVTYTIIYGNLLALAWSLAYRSNQYFIWLLYLIRWRVKAYKDRGSRLTLKVKGCNTSAAAGSNYQKQV